MRVRCRFRVRFKVRVRVKIRIVIARVVARVHVPVWAQWSTRPSGTTLFLNTLALPPIVSHLEGYFAILVGVQSMEQALYLVRKRFKLGLGTP